MANLKLRSEKLALVNAVVAELPSAKRERRKRRPSTIKQSNLYHWVTGIRTAEQVAAGWSDKRLLARANELRKQAADKPDDRLSIEFAGLVAESTFRVLGFRLHDVQVRAAAAGAAGAIVEMQTGEGKTVVTGTIAAIKSLSFPSVHVGTTNTYLAERDLESMVGIFEMLGISYGLLPAETDEGMSRRVYTKQIVYGPGYQYGFDYLRDQMYLRDNRQSNLGMATVNRIRGNDPYLKLIQPAQHHVALIDEADSVMIDEAMTPLVISMPKKVHEDPTPYLLARKICANFVEGADYRLEMPGKKIDVFDVANKSAHDEIADVKNLSLSRPWRIYISNAIRAEKVFQRDVDYVVVDDTVQIVDPYTGRILADRTWQDGLHQAVEAKENVPIQPGRESTTQITRQRYLQMYQELAGLTGTAKSVTDEFRSVYSCRVVEVPTNKPCIRKVDRARFFGAQEAKLEAIANEVIRRHATQQPLLIGTKTIRESLEVLEILKSKGLTPTILNGVQDEEEAQIVGIAGRAGSITIATNMAGRGTDIKLDEEAIKAGGLHVIGTGPNSSKRIDRQLIGRAARQGQPGSAQFFVSATDELFIDNDSPMAKQIARRANKSGEAPDFSRELSSLQKSIETRNFKQRQDMILRDRWMDSVRESIEKE